MELVITTFNNYGYNIPPGQLFISLVVGTALIGLVVYFVLGLIGGIIGTAIKGVKSNQKRD